MTDVHASSLRTSLGRCIGAVRGRRARRRGQGGYILGVVLAAWIVGLTLITALLGLSFATHASAIDQQRLARERRAADGALEVAVEKIRNSGDPQVDCIPGATYETVPMQLGRNPTDPDENVVVNCDPSLKPYNTGGSLLVLGDDYGGKHAFAAVDPGATPNPPSVLHEGPGPMRFVGDVGVRRGSMLDGDVLGGRVSGTYQQGAPGAGETSGCGALADPEQPARRLIDADNGEPTCEVPMPDPSAFPSYTGTPPPAATVPTCDSGSATLAAGYFDPNALDDLNDLLASCDKVVFAPPDPDPDPAVFWFDAGKDGAIEFGRPGASYVFGEELAGIPVVCDPSSDRKLTVVLGGGTGIEHTEGSLTICGGNGDHDALTQADAAAVQPKLSYVGKRGSYDPPEKAHADGFPPDVDPWSDPAEITYCGAVQSCEQGNVLLQNLQYDVESLGVGDVSKLAVQFKTHEFPNTFEGGREIKVDISAPSASCSDHGYGTRGRVADGMGLVFEMPNCAAAFANGAELDGATLDFRLAGWRYSLFGEWTAEVGDILLVANQQHLDVPSGGATTPDGRWNEPGKVEESGSGLAWVESCIDSVGSPVCDRNAASSRADATLRLDFDGATGLEDLQLNRLLVAMDSEHRNDVVAYNMDVPEDQRPKTTVSLDWGAGPQECIAPHTYSHARRTQFLDVSACATGRSVTELAGLKVDLVFSPEELAWYGGPEPVPKGIQIPKFEHIRLLYTTDSVVARPDISTVIHEAGGKVFRVDGNTNLPHADLDVAWTGTAGNLPLFNGGLVISSIGSLGDAGSAVGVVCCGPEYPSIVLTADIDPAEPARGRAELRLEETVSGGIDAVITDWQLCDGGGCEPQVVSPGPSP